MTGPGDQSAPCVSPDGHWILYLEYRGAEGGAEEVTRVMRLPVAGGPPEKVFDTQATAQFRCATPPATLCVVSASDGAETVFAEFDPLQGLGGELARVSAGKVPAWDLSFDATRLAITRTIARDSHALAAGRLYPRHQVGSRAPGHERGLDCGRNRLVRNRLE